MYFSLVATAFKHQIKKFPISASNLKWGQDQELHFKVSFLVKNDPPSKWELLCFTLPTSTNISFLSVDSSSPTIFNQLYLLALSRKSLNCADWELQNKPFILKSDKKTEAQSKWWRELKPVNGLALTILTAAVWLQVAVVRPLLDPDVQLPWQNTDRGGLPTAGRSRQKQDTALQNAKPNVQFHARLKQCFNNPGLRRKIILFICYHHGFPRVKLPLGPCMSPLWWGRVESVQQAEWHTSTHNLDSGANIFRGLTEKRTMHQNTVLVKSIKLLLLLIC